MPAFSFEKISPQVAGVADASAEKKQRGVMVRIRDRIVEGRGKRSLKSDSPVDSAKPESKS